MSKDYFFMPKGSRVMVWVFQQKMSIGVDKKIAHSLLNTQGDGSL